MRSRVYPGERDSGKPPTPSRLEPRSLLSARGSKAQGQADAPAIDPVGGCLAEDMGLHMRFLGECARPGKFQASQCMRRSCRTLGGSGDALDELPDGFRSPGGSAWAQFDRRWITA